MPFITNFQNKYESFHTFGFKVELTLQNSHSQPLLLISAQHQSNLNKFQFIVTNSLVRSQIKELCTNTKELYQVLADGFGGRSSLTKAQIDSNGILHCTYRKVINCQDQERTFQIELNQYPTEKKKNSEALLSLNLQNQLQKNLEDLRNKNKILEKQNADLLNINRSQAQEIAKVKLAASAQTKNQAPLGTKPLVASQNQAPPDNLDESPIFKPRYSLQPAEEKTYGILKAREISSQNNNCPLASTQTKIPATIGTVSIQSNPTKNPFTGHPIVEAKKSAERVIDLTENDLTKPLQGSLLQTCINLQNPTTEPLISSKNPFLSLVKCSGQAESRLKSFEEAIKTAQSKSNDSPWNEAGLFRKSTTEEIFVSGSQNSERKENKSISTSIFEKVGQKGTQGRRIIFGDLGQNSCTNGGVFFNDEKSALKPDFVQSQSRNRLIFTSPLSSQKEVENSEDYESVYTESDNEESMKVIGSENDGESTGKKIIFTG